MNTNDRFNEVMTEAKELMNTPNYDKDLVVNLLTEAIYCTMYEATLKATDTGLKYSIWFDERGDERKPSHNYPRVKIKVKEARGVRTFPVVLDPKGAYIENIENIHDNKKYTNEVIKFVEKYRRLIELSYNSDYYSIFSVDEFVDEFTKLCTGEYKTVDDVLNALFKNDMSKKPNL